MLLRFTFKTNIIPYLRENVAENTMVAFLKAKNDVIRLSKLLRVKKDLKIGPKGGPKHKTAYYEAKWDFKVPKILSWVVKLVCYLNEAPRSIFSTTVRL